jgi:hypothetical protein
MEANHVTPFMVINTAKQVKKLTTMPYNAFIAHLNQHKTIIITPKQVKDFTALLKQSTVIIETNYERSIYDSLLSTLCIAAETKETVHIDPKEIKTVLDFLKTGVAPRFVSHEETAIGHVFQRVFVDPSALPLLKHDILGKFLWIGSVQHTFSFKSFTGEFWKNTRKALQYKPIIEELTFKAYRLVYMSLPLQFDSSLYAQPKLPITQIAHT